MATAIRGEEEIAEFLTVCEFADESKARAMGARTLAELFDRLETWEDQKWMLHCLASDAWKMEYLNLARALMVPLRYLMTPPAQKLCDEIEGAGAFTLSQSKILKRWFKQSWPLFELASARTIDLAKALAREFDADVRKKRELEMAGALADCVMQAAAFIAAQPQLPAVQLWLNLVRLGEMGDQADDARGVERRFTAAIRARARAIFAEIEAKENSPNPKEAP